MNFNRKILIASALILASTFYLLTNCREKEDMFLGKNRGEVAPTVKPNVAPEINNDERQPAPDAKVNLKKKQSEAIRALVAMTKLLSEAIRPETTLEQVVTRLKDYGVEPEITRQSNPDTGDLLIVRSNNPFLGTRYFHAQYFGSDGQAPFPQHISFEFRPGPKAMKEALTAVKQSFPEATQIEDTPEFKKFDLGDDFILWIKKLDAEDLKDDTFNAYDESDLGTIKIAVELEIHEGEEDSSAE